MLMMDVEEGELTGEEDVEFEVGHPTKPVDYKSVRKSTKKDPSINEHLRDTISEESTDKSFNHFAENVEHSNLNNSSLIHENQHGKVDNKDTFSTSNKSPNKARKTRWSNLQNEKDISTNSNLKADDNEAIADDQNEMGDFKSTIPTKSNVSGGKRKWSDELNSNNTHKSYKQKPAPSWRGTKGPPRYHDLDNVEDESVENATKAWLGTTGQKADDPIEEADEFIEASKFHQTKLSGRGGKYQKTGFNDKFGTKKGFNKDKRVTRSSARFTSNAAAADDEDDFDNQLKLAQKEAFGSKGEAIDEEDGETAKVADDYEEEEADEYYDEGGEPHDEFGYGDNQKNPFPMAPFASERAATKKYEGSSFEHTPKLRGNQSFRGSGGRGRGFGRNNSDYGNSNDKNDYKGGYKNSYDKSSGSGYKKDFHSGGGGRGGNNRGGNNKFSPRGRGGPRGGTPRGGRGARGRGNFQPRGGGSRGGGGRFDNNKPDRGHRGRGRGTSSRGRGGYKDDRGGGRGYKSGGGRDYNDKGIGYVETNFKAQICRYYTEGRCSKGEDCKFSHDTTPVQKQELCKYYLQDTCTKGDNCVFMHGAFPCKYFHSGTNCYAGENCKFSHDPLTTPTKALLNGVLDPSLQDRQTSIQEADALANYESSYGQVSAEIKTPSSAKSTGSDHFKYHGFYNEPSTTCSSLKSTQSTPQKSPLKTQGHSLVTPQKTTNTTSVIRPKAQTYFDESQQLSESQDDNYENPTSKNQTLMASASNTQTSCLSMTPTLKPANADNSSIFGSSSSAETTPLKKDQSQNQTTNYDQPDNNEAQGSDNEDDDDDDDDMHMNWGVGALLGSLAANSNKTESTIVSTKNTSYQSAPCNKQPQQTDLANQKKQQHTESKNNIQTNNLQQRDYHYQNDYGKTDKNEVITKMDINADDEVADDDEEADDEEERKMTLGLGALLGSLSTAPITQPQQSKSFIHNSKTPEKPKPTSTPTKDNENEESNDEAEDDEEERKMTLGLGSLLGSLSATNLPPKPEPKTQTQNKTYFHVDKYDDNDNSSNRYQQQRYGNKKNDWGKKGGWKDNKNSYNKHDNNAGRGGYGKKDWKTGNNNKWNKDGDNNNKKWQQKGPGGYNKQQGGPHQGGKWQQKPQMGGDFNQKGPRHPPLNQFQQQPNMGMPPAQQPYNNRFPNKQHTMVPPGMLPPPQQPGYPGAPPPMYGQQPPSGMMGPPGNMMVLPPGARPPMNVPGPMGPLPPYNQQPQPIPSNQRYMMPPNMVQQPQQPQLQQPPPMGPSGFYPPVGGNQPPHPTNQQFPYHQQTIHANQGPGSMPPNQLMHHNPTSMNQNPNIQHQQHMAQQPGVVNPNQTYPAPVGIVPPVGVSIGGGINSLKGDKHLHGSEPLGDDHKRNAVIVVWLLRPISNIPYRQRFIRPENEVLEAEGGKLIDPRTRHPNYADIIAGSLLSHDSRRRKSSGGSNVGTEANTNTTLTSHEPSQTGGNIIITNHNNPASSTSSPSIPNRDPRQQPQQLVANPQLVSSIHPIASTTGPASSAALGARDPRLVRQSQHQHATLPNQNSNPNDPRAARHHSTGGAATSKINLSGGSVKKPTPAKLAKNSVTPNNATLGPPEIKIQPFDQIIGSVTSTSSTASSAQGAAMISANNANLSGFKIPRRTTGYINNSSANVTARASCGGKTKLNLSDYRARLSTSSNHDEPTATPPNNATKDSVFRSNDESTQHSPMELVGPEQLTGQSINKIDFEKDSHVNETFDTEGPDNLEICLDATDHHSPNPSSTRLLHQKTYQEVNDQQPGTPIPNPDEDQLADQHDMSFDSPYKISISSDSKNLTNNTDSNFIAEKENSKPILTTIIPKGAPDNEPGQNVLVNAIGDDVLTVAPNIFNMYHENADE